MRSPKPELDAAFQETWTKRIFRQTITSERNRELKTGIRFGRSNAHLIGTFAHLQ
jgi:hypothetical protein